MDNSVVKLKLALLNSETMVYCTPDTETKLWYMHHQQN